MTWVLSVSETNTSRRPCHWNDRCGHGHSTFKSAMATNGFRHSTFVTKLYCFSLIIRYTVVHYNHYRTAVKNKWNTCHQIASLAFRSYKIKFQPGFHCGRPAWELTTISQSCSQLGGTTPPNYSPLDIFGTIRANGPVSLAYRRPCTCTAQQNSNACMNLKIYTAYMIWRSKQTVDWLLSTEISI